MVKYSKVRNRVQFPTPDDFIFDIVISPVNHRDSTGLIAVLSKQYRKSIIFATIRHNRTMYAG